MSVLHIKTKDEFTKEVLQSQKPVLVDFWATWCGPCRMMGPVIDQLGEEEADALIAKVDVDQVVDVAADYDIQTIPSLVFFKDGKEVKRLIGVRSKSELQNNLKAIK